MDKVISPREIALKILYDIDINEAYANLALKKHLKQTDYKVVDRGLITELVYGIMKYRLTVDYIISQFSKVRIKKISPWILNVLRLGVYQIIYLDRVPDAAACNESVKLAKKYGHNASVRFVNGVLRSVSRNKEAISFPDKKQSPIQYLSITSSHPEWMIKNWIDQYGYPFTEELCQANNQVPDLIARVNTLKTTRNDIIEILKNENVIVEKGKYCEEAIILKNIGNINDLKSFQDGLFQIQDESSMLVSRVVDPQPGEQVIDVCCAPGGKTTHMAQLMRNEGKIVGWDIHEHKIRLVKQTAKRLGIKMIEAEARDATIEVPKWEEQADRVLVDAPCSGLGIIRRKPDIKWNKVNGQLEDIVTLQKRILEVSSKYVKPGGVLVYSTCTIQDEENIGVVEDFLKYHSQFTLQTIEEYFPEEFKKSTLKQGYIQLFPHTDHTDGFFICKMKRKR